MNNVLKSMRLHIGIFGKRNVGKSSLLNLLTGQDVSVVSDVLGTTTDAVEKTMELLPVGPVLFIDTAGIDDVGDLGEKRIEKTFDIINRIDIALIVCDFNGIDNFEQDLIQELSKHNIPFGFIVNKNDVQNISDDKLSELKNITENVLSINTKDENFINQIKQMILNIMPDNFFDDEKILNDIIFAGDTVIQIIPIDKAAPKGRLILPQVRTIRNVLDIGANSIVTNVEELNNVLNNLKQPPKLVITDSQAFKKVNEIVPDDIPLTSYSILFARLKGDLKEFFEGAKAISTLKDNDKVLICESCTHHVTCEDIARVKIPKLMQNYTNKNLRFEFYSGHNFPKNLKEYSLIIHCGACMTNKKEVLSRIILAKENNIPITNYGIAISCCLGILERAIKIFNI